MRIFLASHSSANTTALPSSRIWHINLDLSLKQMGIQLLLPSFDVAEQHLACVYGKSDRTPAESRAYYSERLWDDVQAAHKTEGIDLFFSYYYSASIDPGVIELIRELGVPTVNFYCNSISHFELIEEIAPHFDLCWVPEREALPLYEGIGANAVHLPMAANPQVYHPYDLPVEYDVTFVGQRYLNREAYLAYLYFAGVDVRVWGPKWDLSHSNVMKRLRFVGGSPKRWIRRFLLGLDRIPTSELVLPLTRRNGPLSDEDLVKMYSRSKISLGFSDVGVEEDGKYKRQVHLRDFEAPMSGACYFTGYQEEMAEYYEIGKEIICYDTREELLDKVWYYLAHEDEAQKIRLAGLRRAQRDHTWEKRFHQLFGILGLE